MDQFPKIDEKIILFTKSPDTLMSEVNEAETYRNLFDASTNTDKNLESQSGIRPVCNKRSARHRPQPAKAEDISYEEMLCKSSDPNSIDPVMVEKIVQWIEEPLSQPFPQSYSSKEGQLMQIKDFIANRKG